MEDSALVSPNIKEYVAKHKLEDKLNEAINDVLKSLPNDPFAKLCSFFRHNSSDVCILEEVFLVKTITMDFKHTYRLDIKMNFKGQSSTSYSANLLFSSSALDNLNSILEQIPGIFNSEFYKITSSILIESQSNFDKVLKDKCEDIKSLVGVTMANNISLAIMTSQSKIKQIPLHQDLYDMLLQNSPQLKDLTQFPNLGFTIFKTGKSMNSKIKFERFILIINNSQKLRSEEISSLVIKIYASIRKILTSGKAGESGMRMNNEGSYYPPNDSLNDAIKAMEDIIKDTGESSKLSIGIDCNANNYFVETTKKYEMDGFKQPPEAEALIDFYLKFCHDHPLISYLEDPLADSDISGWNKIHSKFDSKSHIFVTSKSLVSRNLSSIQNLIEMKQLEEVLESQSEEEKKHVQEANKLKLQQNAGKVDLLNISLGIGSCVTVSELFDCHKIFRQKSHKGLSVWDAAGESDQHIAVDLAFALKANYFILHGLNNRSERMIKVNRYLELIEKSNIKEVEFFYINMVDSLHSKFTIFFKHHDDTPYHMIESRDKKIYLCAATDESFYIHIKQRIPNKVCGVRLFIDGEEVNSIKTLKYQCHYYGFKLGGGKYRRFLFDIPNVENENSVRKENKKLGTIKLEFFETDKIKSKKKHKSSYKNYKPYVEKGLKNDTKFFERPLTVKEGNEFTINDWGKDAEKEYEHIIDYSKKIDEVKVHYTDFVSLQIKGVLSLNNARHLKYITNDLLKKEEYFCAVLNTLIGKYGPIEICNLEFLFEQNTERTLRKLHQYSDISSYIKNFPCQFKIEDGMIIKSNAQEIINKLCILPVAPPELYFSTGLDSRNSNSSDSPILSNNNLNSLGQINMVGNDAVNTQARTLQTEEVEIIDLDDTS